MESWTAIDIPQLSGDGPPLRLYDTARQELRPSATGPIARMYVCGITPYDATHLGHAATYISFDLIHRLWRDAGRVVNYVQNVSPGFRSEAGFLPRAGFREASSDSYYRWETGRSRTPPASARG